MLDHVDICYRSGLSGHLPKNNNGKTTRPLHDEGYVIRDVVYLVKILDSVGGN